MKCYKTYHYHSYINFEQFKQRYCSSFIENDKDYPFPTIDMFNKCDSDKKFHIKSDDDYLSIYQYIYDFICQSNECVNRSGPVCPFMPRSLKQQSTYFFIISNDDNSTEQRLTKIVRQCKYHFLHRLKPIEKKIEILVYKCLIILIRSSNISHSMIDQIQTALKPEFVLQYGLMIGEFYESSNSTAKRNEDFYPLRTRVPLLVIRYMVADDITFLNQKHKYPVNIRLNMIKKYLQLYHSGLLYRAKPSHLEFANTILEELNSSVKQ